MGNLHIAPATMRVRAHDPMLHTVQVPSLLYRLRKHYFCLVTASVNLWSPTRVYSTSQGAISRTVSRNLLTLSRPARAPKFRGPLPPALLAFTLMTGTYILYISSNILKNVHRVQRPRAIAAPIRYDHGTRCLGLSLPATCILINGLVLKRLKQLEV
ncbi:hypothetical protein FA95DRAFT_1325438 [Auriscalpium vulgare]|uniref:Uncharacterized protein n=1 Tax=Auriscalpium vulgare TaxID=40419 RepID=A0ACB8S783_9AGAM|nr:hypothetical protein FA95DRAFT_1325438 [Auriscalpium vulgare]